MLKWRPGAKKAATEGMPGGLSTFEGVFTPSILTILGVIMYLRFGWVVGNVGLVGALLIVTLSTSITFLTALSISAIATDQRVRTGGAYYMISRSLGIESGGAIGIPLYIAQGLSVALYTVGFAESVVQVFPQFDQRWVGLVTTVGVAALALVSARVAVRSQYFIMAAIGISLVSLLLGRPIEPTEIELFGAADRLSEPFWTVFAVFFPAVTGIMAGVNLSGDLENPNRSIPRGTFAAIGVGYLIYMSLPVILAMRADATTLIEDPLIMRRISFWGDAILLGVWGATLSSALGSILGAPRVLQALARDGVLPRWLRWLGKGSGADDTPRAGTAVTLALALVAVWYGDLNLIAPVLTMFFLTTYGVLNVAAGLERFLGSPSFRPTFRVHWAFSLLGAVGCIAVMLTLNAMATFVAFGFVALVFFWLQRREMEAAWGDVRRGIWMALTRSGLMRIDPEPDAKNWRPHLLVLSGAPTRRWPLIDLATSITHNRALMTVATVVPREFVETGRKRQLEGSLKDYLAKRGVQSLVRVQPADNPFAGAEQLVETYGLGGLRPNTVIIGDSQEPAHLPQFCRMIHAFHEARRNLIILRDDFGRLFGERKRIDVWWGGLKGNGGLMLILAYLLRSSLDWRGAEVHLKMMVPNEDAARGAGENIDRIVRATRTGAVPDVIVSGGRSFGSVLHETSADADLVLLGLAAPGDEFGTYFQEMRERTSGLPTTLYVLAAEQVGYAEVLR